MLSMSLTARLRISPWVRESKYFSGRRDSFSSTSWRSAIDGLLCHARHHILLNVQEDRADDVESQQNQQDRARYSRNRSWRGQMVLQRQEVRYQTIKELGGCQAQDLRANDVEDRTKDGA